MLRIPYDTASRIGMIVLNHRQHTRKRSRDTTGHADRFLFDGGAAFVGAAFVGAAFLDGGWAFVAGGAVH